MQVLFMLYVIFKRAYTISCTISVYGMQCTVVRGWRYFLPNNGRHILVKIRITVCWRWRWGRLMNSLHIRSPFPWKFRIIFKRTEESYSLRWWDFFFHFGILFVSSTGRNVNAVDPTSWTRKSWRFRLFMTREKVETFFVSLGFWVMGIEKR